MRICFQLDSKTDPVFFPFRYHEYLQAAIYQSLSPEHAQKLHDQGFLHGKRSFKLFTFSRLLGRKAAPRETSPEKGIWLHPPFQWYISSPVEWIMQEMAEYFLRKGTLQLGQTQLTLIGIEVLSPPEIHPPVKIKMLSPMTIYSTFRKPDGKKVTHYYSPMEKDFSILMTENARKKFQVLYNQNKESQFLIRPISQRNRERIIYYKGTVIRAWDGQYELVGDPDLIRITYECGLGSKNSQGFGMWTPI
ncbi:MAG: CRISPR-associated endoribonuclease Cas6 [Calditrichaeota bacterium]|nr:CRISPR-associated endoribonuclease Cas6 [Calditrichota bacterium]